MSSLLNKKSIDDIDVKGKKVLVRCDFNVPLKNGVITDTNRLTAALPTIKKLIADGGKIILCSHLGKPKGEPKPELSLAPVAAKLTELLGQEVKFAADNEVVGPNAKAAVEAMKDGDVILLENTRYRKEETKNGEEFSKELASLCDVFVNDAFGTAHRAHCSNVGVASIVDTAVVGLKAVMREILKISVALGGGMSYEDVYSSFHIDLGSRLGGTKSHLSLGIHALAVFPVAHASAETEKSVSVIFINGIFYAVSRRRVLKKSIVVVAVNIDKRNIDHRYQKVQITGF